jgi:SAM-dependent methyltransferase
MEKTNCVICSPGSEAEIFLQAHSGGHLFSYLRCQQCGLVFLSPRPNGNEILRFYEPGYYGENTQKFRFAIEIPRLFFARKRVRRVQTFFARPGNALDIGCGQGTFLRLLQEEGWECRGTELTEESAARASRRGFSVSVGEFDPAAFPAHSFDLISLWHVLEHLRNPRQTLGSLPGLLKGGGIVAISTPNMDSLQAEVGKEKWFHLDPPRHLYLFSPHTLGRIMDSLGFRLLKIYHFSMEQNPYGWMQSLLNLAGLPENSLYGILKNSPNSGPGSLSPLEKAKTVLLAGAVLPHSLYLSMLMALFRRGGTFEAYFQLKEM